MTLRFKTRPVCTRTVTNWFDPEHNLPSLLQRPSHCLTLGLHGGTIFARQRSSPGLADLHRGRYSGSAGRVSGEETGNLNEYGFEHAGLHLLKGMINTRPTRWCMSVKVTWCGDLVHREPIWRWTILGQTGCCRGCFTDPRGRISVGDQCSWVRRAASPSSGLAGHWQHTRA